MPFKGVVPTDVNFLLVTLELTILYKLKVTMNRVEVSLSINGEKGFIYHLSPGPVNIPSLTLLNKHIYFVFLTTLKKKKDF